MLRDPPGDQRADRPQRDHCRRARRSAVQQMQRADDLWLAAFDSNIETIDALQTGTVDTLIVQNTYGMGYFGVESAYKLLAGQGSSVEKSNITATRTITRENMFAMDKQKALFPFGMTPEPSKGRLRSR